MARNGEQVLREGSLLGTSHLFEINLQFLVHLSKLCLGLILLPDFKTLLCFEKLVTVYACINVII